MATETVTLANTREDNVHDFKKGMAALKAMLMMTTADAWEWFSGMHEEQQAAYLSRCCDIAHECSEIADRLITEGDADQA
ncbi:MAG: hypothetical protein KGN16_06015 [Burkholderiales bacterium]|nr:hypothetical protein [Burkholderiales bacterium]